MPAPQKGEAPHTAVPPMSANIDVIEVAMTNQEVRSFYDGACNAAFWPLYHDAIIPPVFRDDEFAVYQQINQRFADCVIKTAPDQALVWVHDYHLQLVPAQLREARPSLRIGYFLHVPFPRPEVFDTLPWKESVLRGLLGADLIGFQTAASAENFLKAVKRNLSLGSDRHSILVPSPTGLRRVRVGVFPVGPDAGRLSALAMQPAMRKAAAQVRADLGGPKVVLLGVDRLDYTKGIERRIQVVADLQKSAAFAGLDLQFIQVAMPSRSDVAAYQHLRDHVQTTLRCVNDDLVASGLRPIRYINQALPTEQVVALYMAADVMLVTSLADGMNLVCKEYVACHPAGDGRLVLSKSTGAAEQLRDAWLVDPTRFDDVKQGIAAAIGCNDQDARLRMNRLRQTVLGYDALHWGRSFMSCLQDAE
jgi:trehalose-6-phosphate synthase